VSKPALLHRIEWHAEGPEPVPVSAEVLTLVTDPVASRERFLRTAPDLVQEWFRDLAASLAALRAYPTGRRFPVHSAEEYGYLLIHGGAEVLPSQSREMLRKRKPYAGCNAGITHFHADPHGKASICKVGRDP
jgi:hypothetical protein